jgi:catechol 2,3-dioxygenase-like lactoylglutathione lyase family enzyme
MNLGRFELCLQVADIERSLGFYTKLGFHPVASGAEHGVVVIRSGDCRIGLRQGHIAENLLNFRGGNMAEIAREAKASGLEFEKPPFVGGDGGMGALLRGPHGNAVNFVSHPEEQGK